MLLYYCTRFEKRMGTNLFTNNKEITMSSNSSATSAKTFDKFSFENNELRLTRTSCKGEQVICTENFVLTEIDADSLFEARASGKPGFVFKCGSALYYTKISKKARFFSTSNLGTHLCSKCKKMSALSDSHGGCRKVRDICLTSPFLCQNKTLLKNSKRIEKYKFITLGFESFNTTQDAFIVLKCQNYKLITPHPKISASEANILKASLFEFLHEGIFDKV